MSDGPRIRPFAISLVSLALIMAGGFIALWNLNREDPKPPEDDGPPPKNGTVHPEPKVLNEEERENAVIELSRILRQASLSWKRRAATSGVMFLSENWKGTPWLQSPPSKVETYDVHGVRLEEWKGEEGHDADKNTARVTLRSFFRGVRSVTYCVFKVIALASTEKGIEVKVKLELRALTEGGGVIERREKHKAILRDGQFHSSVRLSGRQLVAPTPWFVERTAEAGVQVPTKAETERDLPIPSLADPYAFLAGVAVGDYDADGDMDIYVPRIGLNRLYRNEGDGTFVEVAKHAGVHSDRESASALFLDYDGDGDLDLMVANLSPKEVNRGTALQLFRNKGDGAFEEVTKAAGLETVGPATSLAAADIDLDGDLDLYVCMYKDFELEDASLPIPIPNAILNASNGVANQLWINNGGTFTESAEKSGVASRGWSFAASFSDYDRDGDADLYVANDFGINRLYRNKGDGRFEEVAYAEDPGFGMGVSWADVNGDGRMDLYVSNMSSSQGNRIIDASKPDPKVEALLRKASRGNSLFLNEGEFREESGPYGVAGAGWAWGSVFFDADHDGREDLLVMNGYLTGESESDL